MTGALLRLLAQARLALLARHADHPALPGPVAEELAEPVWEVARRRLGQLRGGADGRALIEPLIADWRGWVRDALLALYNALFDAALWLLDAPLSALGLAAGWVEEILGSRLSTSSNDEQAVRGEVSAGAGQQRGGGDQDRPAGVRAFHQLPPKLAVGQQAGFGWSRSDRLATVSRATASGERGRAGALAREARTGVAQLRVPLEVEVGVGASWAEAH